MNESPRRGRRQRGSRRGWCGGPRIQARRRLGSVARHPHGVAQPFHRLGALFFLCEITGGDPRPGPETSEVAFFAEHELPAELSTRRVLSSPTEAHV